VIFSFFYSAEAFEMFRYFAVHIDVAEYVTYNIDMKKKRNSPLCVLLSERNVSSTDTNTGFSPLHFLFKIFLTCVMLSSSDK
jgi:hypothetical protein